MASSFGAYPLAGAVHRLKASKHVPGIVRHGDESAGIREFVRERRAGALGQRWVDVSSDGLICAKLVAPMLRSR